MALPPSDIAPLGWQCRARLVKQFPPKPTVRRSTKYDDFVYPGPGHYDAPGITGGNGFSQIKKAPAFTFGFRRPIVGSKPAALPKAPVYNISHMNRKGIERIPQGIIAIKCSLPGYKSKQPGPSDYTPKDQAQIKRMPAYSMRKKPKPDYAAWDQWTPPPNMYCPPIPAKNPPKYSIGNKYRLPRDQQIPGPGDHDPNYDYVKKTKPAFSLKGQLQEIKAKFRVPAPNEYCQKRFMYAKPCAPASSFGIKHSPYVGRPVVYELPSDLEPSAKDVF